MQDTRLAPESRVARSIVSSLKKVVGLNVRYKSLQDHRGARARFVGIALGLLVALATIALHGAPAAASLVEGSWPETSGPIYANQTYGYPYPDAPQCTYGGACVADKWLFYQGQCTSWVAYRLNQLNGVAFNDYYGGVRWGDASNWGLAAESLHIAVNGTPAVGSVAWWQGMDHVAYVEQVLSPTSVVISEMNYDYRNGFRVWTIDTTDGYWPTAFIHIADTSGGSLSDGSFVQVSGSTGIYEIAGGAPLFVSNWADVGGPQPYTVISQEQFNSLKPVPVDGTFLTDTSTGMVYEIAGGAPIYVSSWSAFGTTQPTVHIDHWDLANITNPAAHMNPVPANGTFISDSATGMVYEIAGGAPLYVSSWSIFGGGQPTVRIDHWDIENITNPAAHMNPVPANGTFLRDAASGTIWRTVGGAALDISSCDPLGGCPGAVNIDPADVQNAGGSAPWDHLEASPADGTIVEGLPSQRFWVFGSGPCLAWSGSPSGAVQVDDTSLSCATPPGAPVGLSASGGDRSVSLSWSPPAVDNGAAVTGYNIYRSMTPGAEGSRAGDVAGTNFTDSGLSDGTTYYYEVTATNAAGEGSPSAQVSATPEAPATTTTTTATTDPTATAMPAPPLGAGAVGGAPTPTPLPVPAPPVGTSPPPPTTTPAASSTTTVATRAARSSQGYWFVASDGGVFRFGSAGFYGSAGKAHLREPVVSMAATPDGHGYWLATKAGQVLHFGDAHSYGSASSLHLAKPIVAITVGPGGRGYWLVASDGGIFGFGTAQFQGSTGRLHLSRPIVGAA